MAWIVFVVSLTFIVGIQAYRPGCNGTEPWPIKDLVGLDFINNGIRSHVLTVRRSQSKMHVQLSNFRETIEHMYTESLLNTDWEKVRGIKPSDVKLCHEYATEATKKLLGIAISSLQLKYDDLSNHPTTGMEHLFFFYQDLIRDESAIRQNEIEVVKRVYAAICKGSGTLAEDFDAMARVIKYAEKYVLQPVAERCIPLINNM